MKRALICLTSMCLLISWAGAARAKKARLSYNLVPGQVWVMNMTDHSVMETSGRRFVFNTITTIEYRVAKGPKSDWVSLTARILYIGYAGQKLGIEEDMAGISFYADMYKNGEIRNIRHEVGALPPRAKDMTPQDKEGLSRSLEAQAKDRERGRGVFWFPVLPETPLAIGDEFEDLRKMKAGGAEAPETQTVSKGVFTLEEVSDGLAHFTVRERTVQKGSGVEAKSHTNIATKGDAVFDLKAGMWVDLVEKSKIKMTGGQEMFQVTKKKMVRKK